MQFHSNVLQRQRRVCPLMLHLAAIEVRVIEIHELGYITIERALLRPLLMWLLRLLCLDLWLIVRESVIRRWTIQTTADFEVHRHCLA